MAQTVSITYRRYRTTGGALLFRVINTTLLLVVVAAMVYPFVYVISASISQPGLIHQVVLLPKGFDLTAYERVFQSDLIIGSYWNTIYYSIVGVVAALLMLTVTAYPLSMRGLYGKRLFMIFFVITLFFDGGLIPTYLVIRALGLYDSVWALALPPAINVLYLVIARTHFEQIPDSLREAAQMDGANDVWILTRVYLPLSLPILMTLLLFVVVGHWNSFFAPLIYIKDLQDQPLQVILRDILVRNSFTGIIGDFQSFEWREENYVPGLQAALRAAATIVSTGPILLAYPFVQKYFVRGVLVGSIKE